VFFWFQKRREKIPNAKDMYKKKQTLCGGIFFERIVDLILTFVMLIFWQ